MKIVIIDEDSISRVAIERVLRSAGLLERCVLADHLPSKAEAETAYIQIGPSRAVALEIKDSDYFAPPLRIGALLERVQRYAAGGSNVPASVPVGPYVLDVTHNMLMSEDGAEPIRLTDKESHMLAVLAAHKGKSIERRALLDEVWDYADNVETHTLETHIYRLRQKIEKDPSNPTLLLTEEQGYRLSF